MLKKSSHNWTIKKMFENVRDGHVNFDIAIQRNLVWDHTRNSLLIKSLIQDFPVPPMYFALNENRVYDGLDGKQRTNAFMSFIENDFELDDGFIVHDKQGSECDFSDHTFKDLPEWARDAILSFSLYIEFFTDLSEDDYQEMFWRLNYGKAPTPVELTRVKSKSLRMFQRIANHDMVNLSVTEKGKVKFNHENFAMQAWAACFALDDYDNLSFETRVFRPFIEKADVTESQAKEMENILNIVFNIFNACSQSNKTEKRIATKIKTRTHLVALCKAISEGLDSGYAIDDLTHWTKTFFHSDAGPSVDAAYNAASGGAATGTAKRKQIDARINAMIAHMHLFMKKIEGQGNSRQSDATATNSADEIAA